MLGLRSVELLHLSVRIDPESGELYEWCSGLAVVRVTSLPASAHAQWCEVLTADMDVDWIQSVHNSRMLRFNAEQLWQNLLWQGWERVPPQW